MTKEQRRRAYVKSYLINEENEPGFFAHVGDIFHHEKWQSMKGYIQHADMSRTDHIMSVAYLSYLEALERGLNFTATARGAMLHDLYYFDWHNADDGSHRFSGYRHPGMALRNSRELFNLSPLEEEIICRHMWPLTVIPPTHKESMLVSLTDKYCATQEILIYKLPEYGKKFREELEEMRKTL